MLESLERHINLLICQLIDVNQEKYELIFPILSLAALFILIINFTLNLHRISIHLIYPHPTHLISFKFIKIIKENHQLTSEVAVILLLMVLFNSYLMIAI